MRRWPWISRADYALLQQMPNEGMALEFMQLLREQAVDERARRDRVITEADLGEGSALTHIDGHRQSRWFMGPGGGRRTPTRETE